MVDPARFQQVLWNLLNNSHKFTPSSGTITVRSSNPEPGKLQIRVSDTGAGIEAEFLPRIFKAFEQADPATSRRLGGLGLGLAICKAIVDAHGGTVSAHSEGKGQGSTLMVEIPTIPVPSTAPRTIGPALNPAIVAASLRILVVEDHAPTLSILERLLRRMGHHVISAASVAAAVRAATENEIDLLLSDLGLPDGNGCDIMRQLRGRKPVVGIAVTGYGMPEDLRDSREAGFTHHLIKPVDVQQLMAVIKELEISRRP
jgi:CheY-like chemotaxis protein